MRKTLLLFMIVLLAPVASVRAQEIPEEARKQLIEVLGGPFIVYRDKVQDELKINDDQKKALTEKFPDHIKATMEVFEKIKDLKQPEREKALEEHRRKSDETLSATLKDVLDDKQRVRLFQIRLQEAGVFALLGENEVFLPMKISDEQRKQFRAVVMEMEKKIAPLAKEAEESGKPEEIRPKAVKIRKEHAAKIEALLTARQKELWKDILGKPFELGD